MANEEFVSALKSYVGKQLWVRVRTPKDYNDLSKGHNFTDYVGKAEKIDMHEESGALCLFLSTKTEALAIKIDAIEEVDDEIPQSVVTDIAFAALEK